MAHNKGNSKHSKEVLEDIRRMWVEEGLSAGQIARVLCMTRNAVIGIVHRKGWGRTTTGKGTNLPKARPVPNRVVPTPQLPKPVNRAELVAGALTMQAYGPVADFPARGLCRYMEADPAARDAQGKPYWQCCGYPTGDLAKHPQGDLEKPWCHVHDIIVRAPRAAQHPGTPHNPDEVGQGPIKRVGNPNWRARKDSDEDLIAYSK